MTDDILEDEMKIMDERDSDPQKIVADDFKRPISEMNLRPVHPIDESQTVGDAIALMQKHRFGCIVVTKNGKISGIFTERDILLKIIGKEKYQNIKITDVMTRDPFCLRQNDMIAFAMNNMHVGGYRHIPIVNDHKEPVGVVSIKSVNSWILDHFPNTVTNIANRPFRGVSKRDDA